VTPSPPRTSPSASSGCSRRPGRCRSRRRWTSWTRSRWSARPEVVCGLARPDDDWLYRMTTRVGGMFSETGVDDLANAPVGTGPYTVTARTRGDSLSLRCATTTGDRAGRRAGRAPLLRGRHGARERPGQRRHRRHRNLQTPESLAASRATSASRSSRGPPTASWCCR
jgi:hypothetical protein